MENIESTIIRECQKGNLEKFSYLYDQYIQKIYDFIYYKTLHKQTAEDLTSKTFMKALEKIGSFTMEKGSFSSWLYRIARNNVIDHYRTQKHDSNIDDVWDLSDQKDIKADLDIKNKLAEVEKYLLKLSSDQREIVIMKLWDNLSYNEIAEITGKSVAACKMSFSRTLTKLRSEMALMIFYIITSITNNLYG